MCWSNPSIPKPVVIPPPPPPPPPPPGADAGAASTQLAPASNPSTSNRRATGFSQLRKDLTIPSSGGTGLNIPSPY